MMESRNSYGWGYTGSDRKGFEWKFIPSEKDPCYVSGNPHIGCLLSGYVYRTEEAAKREGRKWLKSTKGARVGTIIAIKSRPVRFEY